MKGFTALTFLMCTFVLANGLFHWNDKHPKRCGLGIELALCTFKCNSLNLRLFDCEDHDCLCSENEKKPKTCPWDSENGVGCEHLKCGQNQVALCHKMFGKNHGNCVCRYHDDE